MNKLKQLFGDKNCPKNWLILNDEKQLTMLIEESNEKPVAIFKHSTTCGISNMVKDKVEGQYDFSESELSFYYLDLLANRPISNKVAEVLKVPHQSPQLILLKEGKVAFSSSHHMIDLNDIRENLE